LNYKNGNRGVFMWSLPRSYLEDNLGDSVASHPVKRRLGGWCEMAVSLGVVVSCQLGVDFCTGGCEVRIRAREAEESPPIEAITGERLLKPLQTEENLTCNVF
jgi:hypothetical protein